MATPAAPGSGGSSPGQSLSSIPRSPYLSLTAGFPLEALKASFAAQTLVEKLQNLTLIFGGPLQGRQGTRWTAESGELSVSCDENRAPSTG